MTPDQTVTAHEAPPASAGIEANAEASKHFPTDDLFHFNSFQNATERHKHAHEGLLLAVGKLIYNSHLAAICTSTVNALGSKTGQAKTTKLCMNLRYALPRENVSLEGLPLRLAEYIKVAELPGCLFDLEIKFNLVVSLTRAMLRDQHSFTTMSHQVVSNWQELCSHLWQTIHLIQNHASTLHLDLPDYSPLLAALKRCEHSYSPYLTDDLSILLPGSADRRRATRYQCGANVALEFNGERADAIVSNISSTGMRLLECSFLQVGDKVRLQLGEMALIEGEVVWKSNGACGVSFNQLMDNAEAIAKELANPDVGE
jgi:hypothetical protein